MNDITSRDGLWRFTMCGSSRCVTVTHLPTGETLPMNRSIGAVRDEIRSGRLLARIEATIFARTNTRVSALERHLGREILHDGQWRVLERCNGHGPTIDTVNVWFAGDSRPVALDRGTHVEVRDPAPQSFTVIGQVREWHRGVSYIPVAAFTGDPAVVIADSEASGRTAVTTVEAVTAAKAFSAVWSNELPVESETRDGQPGLWTVVGLIDSLGWGPALTVLAAVQGGSALLGVYDRMGSSRHVAEVLADTGAEAIAAVERSWHETHDF